MKKSLLIIIWLVGLCALPLLGSRLKTIPYLYQQQKLAEVLGVDIEDYRQLDFPYEYFANTLIPGMAIKEVHQIVRGHEKVFHGGDYSEIYYYFSASDDKAFRYEIMYGEQTFKEFSTDAIYNS